MLKKKFKYYLNQIKELHGDPHYVALGLAIGVFVAITPTIPFHTILAVALAVLLKASKPAAILGVWANNPLTVVFFYYICYKTGFLFIEGHSGAFGPIRILIDHLESDIYLNEKIRYFSEFMQSQAKMFMVMNLGGILLGLPSGVITYIMTKRFFTRLHEIKKIKKEKE